MKLFGGRSLIFLGVAVGLVVGFQNCAQQGLEKALKSEIYMLPELKLTASICNDIRFYNQKSSKFVFLVDMSASNVGDWFYETVGNQKFYYFDKNKATDINGSRFEAIRYFLNNCGEQSGDQFSVIGFSNTAGTLSSGSGAGLSCTYVGFGSSANAKAQLDYLKARQEQDQQWFFQWSKETNKYLSEPTPNSLIMGVTSYSSVLKCAENLLLTDLTSSTAKPADNYFVFFMSDGIPQDKNGTGCNVSNLSATQKEACYLGSITDSMTTMRTAAIARGKNMRFTGVFYGGGTGNSVPVAIDSISKMGGTNGGVALNSFSGQQSALCSLFVSQAALSYKPESLVAVNMTSIRKNGEMLSDSDMDGVDDESEILQGTDPQNPRSSGVSGVLDGICLRLGGVEECREKRASIVCSPNQMNTAGLSDCDFRMLGLQNLAKGDWGIDSDKDGMLDFVEIIKGSDPGSPDMLGDPDGDGVVTRDEIVNGTDPFVADLSIPNYLKSEYSLNFIDDQSQLQCPMGYWQISASRVMASPLLSVQSYEGTSSYFNHGQNEHKIFLFYKLVAQNSSTPKNEYYLTSVNVLIEKEGKLELATPSLDTVNPHDFKLLGGVEP